MKFYIIYWVSQSVLALKRSCTEIKAKEHIALKTAVVCYDLFYSTCSSVRNKSAHEYTLKEAVSSTEVVAACKSY